MSDGSSRDYTHDLVFRAICLSVDGVVLKIEACVSPKVSAFCDLRALCNSSAVSSSHLTSSLSISVISCGACALQL